MTGLRETSPVQLDYASPAAKPRGRRAWTGLAVLFALCELLLLAPAAYFALDPVFVDTHGGATPRAHALVLFLMEIDKPPGGVIAFAVLVLGYAVGLAGAWLAACEKPRGRSLLVACAIVMALLSLCCIAQDWLLARASPISYYDNATGRLVSQRIYGFGSAEILVALLTFFPEWLIPAMLWWVPPARRQSA